MTARGKNHPSLRDTLFEQEGFWWPKAARDMKKRAFGAVFLRFIFHLHSWIFFSYTHIALAA
jgi:hypothetical protein